MPPLPRLAAACDGLDHEPRQRALACLHLRRTVASVAVVCAAMVCVALAARWACIGASIAGAKAWCAALLSAMR